MWCAMADWANQNEKRRGKKPDKCISNAGKTEIYMYKLLMDFVGIFNQNEWMNEWSA